MISDSGEYLRIKDLFERFMASLPPMDEQLKPTEEPSPEFLETCKQLERETITNTGYLLNHINRLMAENERLNQAGAALAEIAPRRGDTGDECPACGATSIWYSWALEHKPDCPTHVFVAKSSPAETSATPKFVTINTRYGAKVNVSGRLGRIVSSDGIGNHYVTFNDEPNKAHLMNIVGVEILPEDVPATE